MLFGQWSLQANPNPVFVADGSGLGTTTLFYSAPVGATIAIYADGYLFCAPSPPSGGCMTGKWVSDGMIFELRNVLTGAVVASTIVQVVATNLTCSAMDPPFYGELTGFQVTPSVLQFSVLGVTNATAVDFLVQQQDTPLSTATSQAATNLGGGRWSAGISTLSRPLGGYRVIARLTAANGQQSLCDRTGFFTVYNRPYIDPSYSCGSIAGQWKDDLSYPVPGTWTLTQAATSAFVPVPVSGTYKTPPVTTSAGLNCPEVTWIASGTMNTSSGLVTLSATNPSPASVPNCYKNTLQQSGYLRGVFCDQASGPFGILKDGVNVINGTFTMRRQGLTPVPPGESSLFVNWSTYNGRTTMGMFEGLLALPFGAPGGFSFAGRTVAEQDSPGVFDGCWGGWSAVNNVTELSGGIWYVSRLNRYGTDYIGLMPSAVGYYQAYRPLNGLPVNCTITVPQQMFISDMPGQSQSYGQVNTLTIRLSPSSVAVSRAFAAGEKPFGF